MPLNAIIAEYNRTWEIVEGWADYIAETYPEAVESE